MQQQPVRFDPAALVVLVADQPDLVVAADLAADLVLVVVLAAADRPDLVVVDLAAAAAPVALGLTVALVVAAEPVTLRAKQKS